jgi:hypothetical protein
MRVQINGINGIHVSTEEYPGGESVTIGRSDAIAFAVLGAKEAAELGRILLAAAASCAAETRERRRLRR